MVGCWLCAVWLVVCGSLVVCLLSMCCLVAVFLGFVRSVCRLCVVCLLFVCLFICEFAVCCLVFVVCCLLFVVWCSLFAALVAACRLLSVCVVCCWLVVG